MIALLKMLFAWLAGKHAGVAEQQAADKEANYAAEKRVVAAVEAAPDSRNELVDRLHRTGL